MIEITLVNIRPQNPVCEVILTNPTGSIFLEELQTRVEIIPLISPNE